MTLQKALTKQERRTRVLALASGGGHWVQLLRVAPAWEGLDVAYAATDLGYESDVRKDAEGRPRFYVIPDANASQKLALLWQAARLFVLVMREWPDVVVTTGASLGYFAIVMGKLFGARTIWIDSIANAEEISLSGRRAGRFSDLWLTQWPELAVQQGSGKRSPMFRGSVL